MDFAQRHNIVVVNDNPYSFILNHDRLSLLQVPGAKSCCIEFNSMSKSHNMPGWRVGMLATNAEFVKWVREGEEQHRLRSSGDVSRTPMQMWKNSPNGCSTATGLHHTGIHLRY